MAKPAPRMRTEDGTFLSEARSWLRARKREGAICPCCQTLAKVYRRKLHAGAARHLIQIYRRSGSTRRWLDPKEISGARGGDYAKLRYWGLVEPRDEGRSAGAWRITPLGWRFVEQHAEIQSHVLIYDGRKLRMDGPQTSIVEVLGKAFNYEELMNA